MSDDAASEAAGVLAVVAASRASTGLVGTLRDLGCATRMIASDPAEAAELAALSPDLIVIDEDDTRNGVALVGALRRIPACAETLILLIAPGARNLRRDAVDAGANDVVMAPADPFDLELRLRTFVALAATRRQSERQSAAMNREMAHAITEISAREREIIRRLMLAAEFRDDQAGDHLTRVAGCCIAIAEGLGLSESEANDIALASTMHDIGKIGVPDDILLKPGALTESEREEMKQHTLRGYRMLYDSPSRLLQLASQIALTHHERWDGAGYPQGLSGGGIPLPGRIVAVADIFDALISSRVYKPAWPLTKARRHIESLAGTHLDPDCVASFLSRWDDVVELVAERPAFTQAA